MYVQSREAMFLNLTISETLVPITSNERISNPGVFTYIS